MMPLRNRCIPLLIFLLGPPLVIALTAWLCVALWTTAYYPVNGEDSRGALLGIAQLIAPLLLVLAAGWLAGLTLPGAPAPGDGKSPPGPGGRSSTGFLMDDMLVVLQHWQVAVCWMVLLAPTGAFVVQPWARLEA